MKLLLDTHVFIWALMDTSRLSAVVKYQMQEPENKVFVSAVSFWEIAIKHSLGKLELNGLLPEEMAEIAEREMGFNLLDLDASSAANSGTIPMLHKDPFDRMLIYQAIHSGCCMVSGDKKFTGYQPHGLKLLW